MENKIKEHKRTADKSIFSQLKTTRDKLEDLLTVKAEGSLRFTNQRYYEMGNRASHLLAFQLRKAQTNTTPHIWAQPKEIAETFADYYKNLYNDSGTEFNDRETQTFLKKNKSTNRARRRGI